MDIKLTNKYKALEPFEWNNIPPFAVVTGLNGTGKSQLLRIIHASLIGSTSIPDRIEISNAAFRPDEVTFIPGEWQLESIGPIDYSMTTGELQNHYANFRSGSWHGEDRRNITFKAAFEEVQRRANKMNPDSVTREEFFEFFPKYLVESEQRLPYALSKAFMDYRLEEIDLLSRGKSANEITEKLGNRPWEVVKSILEASSLQFEINDPSESGLFDQFHFTLTRKPGGEIVNFGDLSSGEKVLFSIASYLYSSREKKVFPKLFLLDEPDAHLHPSMTLDFLNVMKKVLVDQFNARVLMTTHSPSTVALSPEESIFTMHNDGNRIRRTTKDAALKLLTTGVPSFSISYENRRQVFVESMNDVRYYEKIYRRILDKLEGEISLTFISSGESRVDKNGLPISSCDQVINITSVLRVAGNPFIWGLIDRDLGNEPSDFVKVLGNGSRYSIESYLFDPLLVAALLLREKFVNRATFGLPETATHMDLRDLDDAQFQRIADHVISEVEKQVKPDAQTRIAHKYLNGREIELPNWYVNFQGHELESKVVSAFPSLGQIKRGEEETLKNYIIDKVIDDLPELISEDILTAFRELQAL